MYEYFVAEWKLKLTDDTAVQERFFSLFKANALQCCCYLLCDVEGLAVGLVVEPHAAKRLSNDGVVRLLQPLRFEKNKQT